MKSRVFAFAAIALFGATVLSGCSEGQQVVESPESAALSPSAVVPGAYALPLDAIMYPDEAAWTAQRVLLVSTLTECMASRGFELLDKPTMVPSEMDFFGITDPEFASVYGYTSNYALALEAEEDGSGGNRGSGVEGDGPQPLVRPAGYWEALSGLDDNQVQVKMEDGQVLASYDPNACDAIADRTVSPEFDRESVLQQVLFDIVNEAGRAAEQSEQFLAGQERWAACMKNAGHEYAGVWAAWDANAGNEQTAKNIETAVADATCKQETGFLKDWSAVMAAEQQKRLDAHPGVYNEWFDIQEQKKSIALHG